MAFKEVISNVMELPYSRAVEESASKLTRTFLKINKKLVFLHSIDGTYLVVYDINERGDLSQRFIEHKNITSMETWLPRSGIYTDIKGGNIHVKKLPHRQWKRSLCNENYSFHSLKGKERTEITSLDFIEENKNNKIVLDKSSQRIYYFDTAIGRMYIEHVGEASKKMLEYALVFKPEIEEFLGRKL